MKEIIEYCEERQKESGLKKGYYQKAIEILSKKN